VTSVDPYRGPRVIARSGSGQGSYVWVVPAIPGPSPEELEAMGESMASGHYAATETEAEELLIGVFESAVGVDDRPGYSDFYYDPQRDGEIDEFADDLELSSADSRTEESAASRSSEQVVIKVLGPVEIEGWREVPKRRIVSELACYLALHATRPISGEVLRAALWPDVDSEAGAKSLRNYMSELRRALGSENVPTARGTGYSVSSSVQCDWTQFTQLVKSTQWAGSNEAELLRDALSLVRGRPFTGVTYNWAFSELMVSEMEVGISDGARRLAAISMASGDPATAAFAARRGLLVTPFDVTLWEIALQAAAGMSGDELTRTWRDARAMLGEDAAELANMVRDLENS
jgi:DNA-binding winged helix-turn-helix (wHTH) protein